LPPKPLVCNLQRLVQSTGQNLSDATIAKFQRELGAMGYKYQVITLAGFHSLNYGMFDLAYGYARNNMTMSSLWMARIIKA
jgi:isocitrate lyase